MQYMLCKNTVKDSNSWLTVFNEETANANDAGLTVERMFRDPDDDKVVYFLMRVDDKTKAEAYTSSPESANAGERAGVTGGSIQYLNEV